MIRRINLALMETVLAEQRRRQAPAHPIAEYIHDWLRVHTPPAGETTEREYSITVSLNGQVD